MKKALVRRVVSLFLCFCMVIGFVPIIDAQAAEIKGGTFKGDPQWTLNCQDGSGSVITVKGGTFYKFDPSNANVGAGEIVVPDSFKVVQNGDWYTVVAE